MDEHTIKLKVREHYGQIAVKNDCGCGPGCCSSDVAEVVPLIDYSAIDDPLVAQANLGLGCGLPTGFADFRPGETVLDLGSGAGVDVFIAARQVGPAGRAIGVDMTPEMVWRARQNAEQAGLANVEFRLGEIESLPVETGSVDAVISNCVLNLVPDKVRAFAEIYRALKPGGRISISDVVSYGQIPATIRQDAEAWAGCIAGALDRDAYMDIIRSAGFANVRIAQQVDYDAYRDHDYGFASITVQAEKL